MNAPIYPFTNENLHAYLPLFDLQGKDVLTVVGSGDHPLNMALHGAKTVSCFDKNPATNDWFELKRKGILSLGFAGFKKEFLRGGILDNGLQLTFTATQGFWEQEAPRYQKANTYLYNEHNFNELKRKLCNVKFDFKCLNVFDAPKVYDRKFDAIFTSNICSWVDTLPYLEFTKHGLRAMLNKGGVVQTHYAHTKNFHDHYYGSIVRQNPEYHVHEFESFHNSAETSTIITLSNF